MLPKTLPDIVQAVDPLAGLADAGQRHGIAAVEQVGDDVPVHVAVDGDGCFLAQRDADEFIGINLTRDRVPSPCREGSSRKKATTVPPLAWRIGMAWLNPVTGLKMTSSSPVEAPIRVHRDVASELDGKEMAGTFAP